MTFDLSEIRQKLIATRKSQFPAVRAQKNEEINSRLKLFFHSLGLPSSSKIALYRGKSEEVSLESFIQQGSGQAHVLYYPRVVSTEPAHFELIKNPQGWKSGRFGLLEPTLGEVLDDEDALDCVFVPGVAFGPQGERIGMGVGFYDRFFERCRKAIRIGVAFDFQIYPGLPQNPWDQRVDFVITETREFKTPRFQEKLDRLREKP